MKKLDYKNCFKPCIKGLRKNALIRIPKRHLMPVSKEELERYADEIPKIMIPFYSWVNGFELQWDTTISDRPDDMGTINLLSIKHLFDDTVVKLEGKKWLVHSTDFRERDDLKGDFKPLDLFMGDACIGFFSKENKDEQLYRHTFGASFYSLKVNFEGYFQLLCASYGFLWWQNVIIYREYGQEDKFGKSEHDAFKEMMPKLFPDFDFDKFIALYESLKMVE